LSVVPVGVVSPRIDTNERDDLTMPSRITGGVDTHLDLDVVAALDERGGLLGVENFDTTPAGYRQTLDWLRRFGEVELVGVEGTASYGAGLTRHLHRNGVRVVESIARTGSGAGGAARPTRKTRSPLRVPRSLVIRPGQPRPATGTWKPCGCYVSCAYRRDGLAPRHSTRCGR
jgi:hypothetical protein